MKHLAILLALALTGCGTIYNADLSGCERIANERIEKLAELGILSRIVLIKYPEYRANHAIVAEKKESSGWNYFDPSLKKRYVGEDEFVVKFSVPERFRIKRVIN